MWLTALWGFVGAATNCGVVFLEASRRVKGWPWREPDGPGGGVYGASISIQLFVGTATTTAVATTPIVSSGLVAFRYRSQRAYCGEEARRVRRDTASTWWERQAGS